MHLLAYAVFHHRHCDNSENKNLHHPHIKLAWATKKHILLVHWKKTTIKKQTRLNLIKEPFAWYRIPFESTPKENNLHLHQMVKVSLHVLESRGWDLYYDIEFYYDMLGLTLTQLSVMGHSKQNVGQSWSRLVKAVLRISQRRSFWFVIILGY